MAVKDGSGLRPAAHNCFSFFFFFSFFFCFLLACSLLVQLDCCLLSLCLNLLNIFALASALWHLLHVRLAACYCFSDALPVLSAGVGGFSVSIEIHPELVHADNQLMYRRQAQTRDHMLAEGYFFWRPIQTWESQVWKGFRLENLKSHIVTSKDSQRCKLICAIAGWKTRATLAPSLKIR